MDQTRKVLIVKRELMLSQSLRHWSPKLRNKVYRFVFKCKGSFDMPYSVCEDRKLFAQWVKMCVGEGNWDIRLFREGYFKQKAINRQGKKVNRLRNYTVARLEITERGINFINLNKISKFSWFEPKRKVRKLISD